MVIIPHAAIIASCNMMRRNNEEAEKRRKQTTPEKSILTNQNKTKLGQPSDSHKSEIRLNMTTDSLEINYNITDDYDWVRAAWALINICEQKGQITQLQELMSKEMIVKEGKIPD